MRAEVLPWSSSAAGGGSMLLYVTLDGVLGGAGGAGPEPARGTPDTTTLAGLYDHAMRHHTRRTALAWSDGGQQEQAPDWRLDRLVIRLALYCRERLQLAAGERLAVFGPASWLWPVSEYAALGLGAEAVGLEHDLSDEALMRALAETTPRVALATDALCAARLVALRAVAALPESLILPACATPAAAGCHSLSRVLELGATLDTAERAQSFRAACRALVPQAPALAHASAAGLTRLTQAQALASLERRAPGRPHDLAYVAETRVTLELRLAWHGFVGDGRTTLVLGSESACARDLPRLRPQVLLAPADFVERTWQAAEQASGGLLRRVRRLVPQLGWLRRLEWRGASLRAALQARLGDRLRRIEASGALRAEMAEALAAGGVSVV